MVPIFCARHSLFYFFPSSVYPAHVAVGFFNFSKCYFLTDMFYFYIHFSATGLFFAAALSYS